MEIYKEILLRYLVENDSSPESVTVTVSAKEIVESECYKLISKIKDILETPFTTKTEEIFMIEKIVTEFEKKGITVKEMSYNGFKNI